MLCNPKELLTIYNRVKIKYNPTGYSFKDRLIEHPKEIGEELMLNVGYDTEEALLNKIRSFWKTTEAWQSYGTFEYVPSLNRLNSDWDEISKKRTFIIDPMPGAMVIVGNDNLNVQVSRLLKIFDLDSKAFLKTSILEHLVTACYLMSIPKSITADLKWVCTDMPIKFSYENLHNFDFLKNALETEKITEIYATSEESMFDNVNCPFPDSIGKYGSGATFANAKGMLESQMSDSEFNMDTYTKTLKFMYLETVVFGLELAYVISQCPDARARHTIYDICIGKHPSNDFTNLIYKSGLKEFEPAIELSSIPEERFASICAYVKLPSVQDTIDNACDNFINHLGYDTIPAVMGGILSYAKNYSCRNLRIKQCAILYNYCKANGLISAPVDVAGSDESDAVVKFMDAFAEEAGDSFSDSFKSKKSMLDLKEHSHSSGTAPGGGHDGSTVSQALDGLIDNFRTDKYKFTVKDVYDSKDSLKTKYEAIVSKVKLVNHQLIKQIRDIKTYNTGGKYSGLASGKLDRKNLHKYKTAKNIFYNNTYKQNECDLAFGIVLDASGSMWGSGIENGRITMIVLHETLKALGINHSIIDHTCYGEKYSSDLTRYQCFKEDKGYCLKKNYALAGIKAKAGNCDSGALWFMEKALLRTRNKDKICLIFSDGAPTECSDADLVAQVRHMESIGIKVIGIGIGFPNISKYYTDYANGNNLKEMLDIVARILKDYVIAKKD
jgi:hypothetical protein